MKHKVNSNLRFSKAACLGKFYCTDVISWSQWALSDLSKSIERAFKVYYYRCDNEIKVIIYGNKQMKTS